MTGTYFASGFDRDPNTNTAYIRKGFASANQPPSVAFVYNGENSWSASVGLSYDITCPSDRSIVIDRTSFSMDADQDNATLTKRNGSFIITKKINTNSKTESGPKKQKTNESGTLTLTISPAR